MVLPISALKEEVNVYDELIDVATYNHKGKEHKIQFTPLFKYDKIKKLTLQFGQFYQAAMQEKFEIDPTDEDDLLNYFIIKHFGKGLKFTTSKKAKTIYNEFKLLQNSDLYKVFREEVFTNELVDKSREEVIKEIFANIELNAKYAKRLEEAQELIKNLPLENREILENLSLSKDENNNVSNVLADK